jgi:tetratricopeptide (TPR) repeat protein
MRNPLRHSGNGALRAAFLALLASALALGAEAQEAAQGAIQGAAQGQGQDLDLYYRYRVSIGAEYQSLSALSSFSSDFAVRDIAAELRMPLPGIPVIQPFVRAGSLSFTQAGSSGSGPWDHLDYYGALGASYSKRFAKNFELGLEGFGGLAQSSYPQLVAGGPVGSLELLGSLGARIGLVPSYNFAVDLRPSLRYERSLGPLTEFDGFSIGLGFALSYRFGEDPDSPLSIIRALRFLKTELPPAFSSMMGYYSKNPIGRVTLANTEKQALTDVEVSFYQKGYMDAPTPSFTVPRIGPGESLEAPLKAVFNAEVFKLTGGFKPMTGEVIVAYKLGGRAVEQRSAVSYDLYDKTAMTWDDDRKAGAFITTLDSALQNYAAFINETGKKTYLAGANKGLQDAMLTYDALRAIGVFYQEDPTAPFTRVQSNKSLVDFISLPRLTLKRRYGDCKNLTVLFDSLLEARGVRTAFITVPGHIYPVIDTGLPAQGYRDLNPERSMSIALDGTLWVPVEITMLDGKSDFMAAWRQAVLEWTQNPDTRAFYRTADAQALYSPVAVEDQDLGLQYGNADEIASLFSHDVEALSSAVVSGYSAAADSSRDKRDFNSLGIAAAKLGKYAAAEEAFGKALKLDPAYSGALVNLGNVAYLKKDYKKAIASYKSVLSLSGVSDPGKAKPLQVAVLLNLSKAYGAQRDDKQSLAFLSQAAALDPEGAKALGFVPDAQGGTRASAVSSEAAAPIFEEE